MSFAVLWQHVVCVLGVVQRATSIAPSTHTTCFHNTAKHITMYLYWLFLQKCNFSQTQCKLPEDGPGGPKHVAANIRYFNVNFLLLLQSALQPLWVLACPTIVEYSQQEGFYRVPLPAAHQPPNLEDQWFRTFHLPPQGVPSVWNDASEPQERKVELWARNFR